MANVLERESTGLRDKRSEERERERERERESAWEREERVCVCVSERGREKGEREMPGARRQGFEAAEWSWIWSGVILIRLTATGRLQTDMKTKTIRSKLMILECSFLLSLFITLSSAHHTVFFIGVRERELTFYFFENEQERGSNLRRQRLVSPTAQVLVTHTTQPVQTESASWRAIGLRFDSWSPLSGALSRSQKCLSCSILYIPRVQISHSTTPNDHLWREKQWNT